VGACSNSARRRSDLAFFIFYLYPIQEGEGGKGENNNNYIGGSLSLLILRKDIK
jgi:hypothetical protein